MKTFLSGLCNWTLISLLSVASFAFQAEAQRPVSGQQDGLSKVPESTRAAGNGKAAGTGYTYSVLYNFCASANCADGKRPNASLIQDGAGNLYGTTVAGGISSSNCEYDEQFVGCGTIFKIDNTGHETVLYAFCAAPGCADGANPTASLIEDAAGNFYGTTYYGGANGGGTIFQVDETGHETVLYSFCSASECSDGENPYSGLIRDAEGNLYGTTVAGGNSNSLCSAIANRCGTVFKLDSSNHETVLYSFCSASGCIDGANPYAALIQDGEGNLYGTTYQGGNVIFECIGCGTVFRVDPTGHETVLHAFCIPSVGCADGSNPYAGLLRDAAGNLYGTANSGGAGVYTGAGTAFKVDNSDQLTVLHNFCTLQNCADGGEPWAGLIQDAAGSFYGTTSDFGALNSGTVFKLDSAGNGSVLYDFCSDQAGGLCVDGADPVASLILDVAGDLYGATPFGGANDGGVVFELFTGSGGRGTATVTLTSAPNPAVENQAVTLSAVVSGNGTIPGGTVAFKEGATVLGSVTLTGGDANFTTSFSKIGKFSIVASYSGDKNYKPHNSAPVKEVIEKYPTTTTLTSNLNPSTYGQSVTLKASVGSKGPIPTGTVTFRNGSTLLGTESLPTNSVKFVTSTLPAGTLTLTASYSGDAVSAKSTSSALSQVVNQASSTTSVVSSKNPSMVGKTVKFMATVTSPTATPTGSVTFMDGTTELGTGSLAKGKASFSTSALTAGSHQISVVYEGTSDIEGSTSPVLVQTVN